MIRATRFLASTMAIAIMAPIATPAFAQAESYTFNIPAQDLASALRAFARTTHQQMTFRGSDMRGVMSRELKGAYSSEDGLSTLLRGSGFSAHRAERGVIVIARAERTTSADSASSRGAGDTVSTSAAGVTNTDIVVTANKTAERLDKVSASVAVVNDRALRAEHIVSLQDIVDHVPGLAETSNGEPGQNLITIRGVYSNGGNESTTGLYIDDVSVNTAFTGAYEPPFFDFDRVEVLRGPQGTLYGAGSFGGTIRYVRKQPQLDKFSAEFTADAYEQSVGDPGGAMSAVVNLPLIDKTLALRLGGIYQHEGGYITHVTSTGVVSQKNANTDDLVGLRAAVLWKPSDTISITPSIQFDDRKDGDRFYYDPHLGTFKTDRVLSGPKHDQFILGSLDVNVDLGPSNLRSVTGYMWRKINYVNDFTRYDNSTYITPVIQQYYDPQDAKGSLEILGAIPVPAPRQTTNRQFSEDLRFSSNFENLGLRTLLGLYYVTETRDSFADELATGYSAAAQQLFGVDTNQAVSAAFGTPAGYADLEDTLFLDSERTVINRSAAYGEISWSPPSGALRHLTLTVGARYSHITFKNTGYADGFFDNGFSPIDHRFKENQLAPKYKISYDISDSALLYASAAKGFRLGGTNNPLPSSCSADEQASGIFAPSTFKTDTIWNYEAGAKIGLLNHSIQLNGSVFHIRWQDIAESVTLKCGVPFTINAGDAVSNGGDLSVAWRPVSGLNIGVDAAYTDAHFTKTLPLVQVTKGDTVPYSPKWTVAGNIEYSRRIGRGSGYFLADYTYVDSRPGDISVGIENKRLPSYQTVGASFGYRIDNWDI